MRKNLLITIFLILLLFIVGCSEEITKTKVIKTIPAEPVEEHDEELDSELNEITDSGTVVECSTDALLVVPAYDNLKEIENSINDIYCSHSENSQKRLLGLSNILWLENENVVPWSIKDYSKEEIEVLFFLEDNNPIEEKLLSTLPNFQFTKTFHDSLTNQEFYRIAPITLSIIEGSSSQEEAIEKIILWLSKNIRHYVTDTYQPRGYKNVFTTPFEDVFHYRTSGCHRYSKMLVAMLRSINIPAYEIHLKGHGVTYIPTIDIFVHGDLGVKYPALPDASMLMMDRATFLSYAKSDGTGEFYNAEEEIHERYSPLSRVWLYRTNDFKLYLSTLECTFTEEDITNHGDFIRELFPEYEISFEENPECGVRIDYIGGTYKLISNQIPVKEFDEFLDELR
ncbi:transglutaminase-like domain-containing protein [candidate division KSB1 bacterium]